MIVKPSTNVGWLEVTDTDSSLDSLFRSTLPAGKAIRVEDESYWIIHSSFLIPVVRAGYNRFGHVDYRMLQSKDQMLIAKSKGEWVGVLPPITGGGNDPHATLYLLPTAPHEIVKAAWKELSRMHHPDRGGDSVTFSSIQKAYEELNGRKGKQRNT